MAREPEIREHIDRSQVARLCEPLPPPGEWKARLRQAVIRWWHEGISVEPRDGRPDVIRRIQLERLALRAAQRLRRREEDDVLEILYHTLRLLGLERRVHFRKGARPRPR